MDGQKPQLDVRATCKVGGSPGEILPSEDGTLLFVADRELRRVTVVAVGSMKVFQPIDLGGGAPPAGPVLLGSFEDDVFTALHGGKMAVLSAATRQLHGVIDVRGDVRGMAVLGDARQAVVAAADGNEGFIGQIELSPHRLVVRRPLPGKPLPGTFVADAANDRVAVAVQDASGRNALALVAFRSGAPPALVPLETEPCALALESSGEFLYAALHQESEVAIIDVSERRVIERLPMAGKPYQLEAEPGSRRVWAYCEGLGHAALIDPRRHGVVRRLFTPGARRSDNRFVFSPEGRLLALPERDGQCITLAIGGLPSCEAEGEVDRLELGRAVGAVAWNPLGDEIYVSDPDRGEILALGLDRGALKMKDTDQVLSESIRKRLRAMDKKGPLFPP